MAETDFSQSCPRQQESQKGSIPFVWEEKPGTPKKEWKWKPEPEAVPVPVSTVPSPVKLIVSVPFKWEEQPGKPLPCFSQRQVEVNVVDSRILPLPPARFLCFPSPSLLPSSSSPNKSVTMFSGRRNDDHDEWKGDKRHGAFELDLAEFGIGTDDSFNKAPSLLDSRITQMAAISSTVPVVHHWTLDKETTGHETPTTPASEADDDSSSYASGSSSLVGSPFLERLFPSISSDPGFLDKVGYHEKSSPVITLEQQAEELTENNFSHIVERPPTLGELMLMSRRSNGRSVDTRRRSPTMEFIKKRAFGCCMFATGGNNMNGLQMRQQRHNMLQLV
uniref:Uncharacterized protein n=1 Tax=Nelumbo nucifera TaxID=4432 RepID=A0A822YMM4_NELNU|nr:TPA_asm: hypothetical protein HUJ06_012623 [Nelumbo nucifera]